MLIGNHVGNPLIVVLVDQTKKNFLFLSKMNCIENERNA